MLNFLIPGHDNVKIENILIDFNGTLAVDGILHEGIADKLAELSKIVDITVVSADTNCTIKEQLKNVPIEVRAFDGKNVSEEKKNILRQLNPVRTAVIGNGFNDHKMMREARVAIGVMGEEGIYSSLFSFTDICVSSIHAALDLFLKPNRIIATMRK